jgi:hypothetical protein
VPDRILLKPGKLDADEFAIMKHHSILGKEAIVHAEEALGWRWISATGQGDRLLPPRKVGRHGYPYGLPVTRSRSRPA